MSQFVNAEVGNCLLTVSQGGGGSPYNGLHGEAPPERGTFVTLQ